MKKSETIEKPNVRTVRNAGDAIEATRHTPGKRVLLRVWSQGGSRFLIVDEGIEK